MNEILINRYAALLRTNETANKPPMGTTLLQTQSTTSLIKHGSTIAGLKASHLLLLLCTVCLEWNFANYLLFQQTWNLSTTHPTIPGSYTNAHLQKSLEGIDSTSTTPARASRRKAAQQNAMCMNASVMGNPNPANNNRWLLTKITVILRQNQVAVCTLVLTRSSCCWIKGKTWLSDSASWIFRKCEASPMASTCQELLGALQNRSQMVLSWWLLGGKDLYLLSRELVLSAE